MGLDRGGKNGKEMQRWGQLFLAFPAPPQLMPHTSYLGYTGATFPYVRNVNLSVDKGVFVKSCGSQGNHKTNK